MKILADAALQDIGALFPKPFSITRYQTLEELRPLLASHTILICRSALPVNAALLAGSAIQCVATASSGIDHIDTDYLQKNNIHLFDAKGCNANAVADYVTATLEWLEKKHLVRGQQAGVIGVGAIGSQVVQRLFCRGYDVKRYDPDQALSEQSLSALSESDVLCIHANLHQQAPFPSRNLIQADFLSTLKPGVVIINASRGGIVNEADLLQVTYPLHYCTDVFLNEPNINPQVVDFATLCTPHIAGHSIEAKQNAVKMLSTKLHDHFGLRHRFTKNTCIVTGDAKQFRDLNVVIARNNEWQNTILDHYNPEEDSLILKQATCKKTAFIAQRQAHTHRHDFVLQLESFC